MANQRDVPERDEGGNANIETLAILDERTGTSNPSAPDTTDTLTMQSMENDERTLLL